MLNQRKNILTVQPPILQVLANGKWHLISNITQTGPQNFVCECIRKSNNEFESYQRTINEVPFHVAADIWELEYGIQLMTLMHSSLNDHPARTLWQDWCQSRTK